MLRKQICVVLSFIFALNFSLANSMSPLLIESKFLEELEREIRTEVKASREDMYLQNRALELSLYYAGYSYEIFYKLRYYCYIEMLTRTPKRDFWHLKRGKLRDGHKAMEMAKFAKDLARGDCKRFATCLIDSYRFEGIGVTPESAKVVKEFDDAVQKEQRNEEKKLRDLEEKYAKTKDEKLQEDIKQQREEVARMSKILNSGKFDRGNTLIWHPYGIYVHYYGLYGHKKDLQKVKELILLSKEDIWINFYCGFLVPRDIKLARHILKVQDTDVSRRCLKDIRNEE